MKQFLKALKTDGDCLKYLVDRFPGLTDAKIKGGIFVGPQICELMKTMQFEDVMTNVEKNAWISFKKVVKGFLGNEKSSNYDELVNNMLKSFQQLGCNMSTEVHYLHFRLDWFSENLGDISEEQGERFHQNIKEI